MVKITTEQIKQDLETAAYVDRLLPEVRSPKYKSCMPDIIYTPQEIVFMDKRPIKPRPSQEQVDIWEKVNFEWLPVLEVEERRLVWKRANRIPWKLLSYEFGLHRSKLTEKYNVALAKILGFLSNPNVPTKLEGTNSKK